MLQKLVFKKRNVVSSDIAATVYLPRLFIVAWMSVNPGSLELGNMQSVNGSLIVWAIRFISPVYVSLIIVWDGHSSWIWRCFVATGCCRWATGPGEGMVTEKS